MSDRLRVTVREHARLTTAELPAPTLDEAKISESGFEWLCGLASTWQRGGARLLQVENRRWLRLDNFVGVLESPCGLQLEILPKHVDTVDAQTVRDARKLLIRLLASSLDLPARQADAADLMRLEHPLTEWVMGRFLDGLEHVLRRGLRSEYRRVEDEQPFLRGQLDLVRQFRQPLGRAHHFQLRHDEFSVDRPENRLLKSALLKVLGATQQADHWRLANELAHRLQEVPPSPNQAADWGAWRSDRLMAHYQPVRPWCELVLGRHMPIAVAGDTRGISLLFPMERLFERHVAATLARRQPQGRRLVSQTQRHSLCTHEADAVFALRPDMLLETSDGPVAVLDTKWKRIDENRRDDLYGLAQSDFYQLHAYGQVCLGGDGVLALIYPSSASFTRPLPPFHFNERMTLWVLPFDLEADELLMDEPVPFQVSKSGNLTLFDASISITPDVRS